jgi:hypothetical protein
MTSHLKHNYREFYQIVTHLMQADPMGIQLRGGGRFEEAV